LELAALATLAPMMGRLDTVAGHFSWLSTFAVLEGLGAVALSLWLIVCLGAAGDRRSRLAQRAGRGSCDA
jgi:hypothetical protein